MRLIASILTASLAVVALPAAAQDAEPFTGASVVALGGIDHTSSGPGDPLTGFVYGGAVTYDLGEGKLRYGVEAEATGSTMDGCYTMGGTAVRSCTSFGRDLYVGGRVGVVLNPSLMLYGKAGYTNARATGTFDDPSTAASPDLRFEGNDDGYRLGGGLEYDAGKFLIRTEYRYSDYGADRRHQGTVAVGVRF
ncbi:outer membrane beta-barrel protein [Sphingomonas sp. ST-64]|uniref:Outer membrane beta-barrel protein n=1 Tax=Sphingomonas plantiphila TaxID=3163295 RepID=A0ABW8YP35_9SPHN